MHVVQYLGSCLVHLGLSLMVWCVHVEVETGEVVLVAVLCNEGVVDRFSLLICKRAQMLEVFRVLQEIVDNF